MLFFNYIKKGARENIGFSDMVPNREKHVDGGIFSKLVRFIRFFIEQNTDMLSVR